MGQKKVASSRATSSGQDSKMLWRDQSPHMSCVGSRTTSSCEPSEGGQDIECMQGRSRPSNCMQAMQFSRVMGKGVKRIMDKGRVMAHGNLAVHSKGYSELPDEVEVKTEEVSCMDSEGFTREQ